MPNAPLRLIQYATRQGERRVAKVELGGKKLVVLQNTESVYELAMAAGRTNATLAEMISSRLAQKTADYETIIVERRLLPPLDHPDPAHCYITGTGLTHLGSAQARDKMHSPQTKAPETDSMRLFLAGLNGGKPPDGEISVQPEWFYKGNGNSVVSPEHPLPLPPFGLDGGEEAELVGLYVISDSGKVMRVGFALGNEFSDHVMEAQNYLYLAHSKLRTCSFGPELIVGEIPPHIEGRVKIFREGNLLWDETFLTGEENMSFRISGLEHHHFKYEIFRQPGDVHCHFFGTATLSRNAGIATRPGDVFEISAPGFGYPLRNPIGPAPKEEKWVKVRPL